MTLDQLQSELLELSPQEKAQAIQLLVASLGGTWLGIEQHPDVMGAPVFDRLVFPFGS